MRNPKLLLTLLSIAFVQVLSGTSLFGQHGLQRSRLSRSIWSQQWQPANLIYGDSLQFRYGGDAALWFGNAHASIQGVFAENGFITEEVKDRLVDELRAGEVISAGYDIGLASVNVRIKNRTWGFYLRQHRSGLAGFDNPNTLGLILKGNGPYAGETISDPDIFAKILNYRSLGVGTAFDFDKIKLGVRLNLLEGRRMLDLDRMSYSLFTSANGTELDLSASFDLYGTPTQSNLELFEFQGLGASLDAGLIYQVNEKLQIDFALVNLGYLNWTSNNLLHDVNIEDWEGVFVTNIFEDSIPALVEQEVDSLEQLIFPDTVAGNHGFLTPMSIRLGGTYRLGTNNQIGCLIVYSPIRQGAHTRLPLTSVIYQHQVIPGLQLGANAYFGGSDTFGFGAMANYGFTVGSANFDVLLGSDNVLGFALTSVGRGFNIYGGLGVGF